MPDTIYDPTVDQGGARPDAGIYDPAASVPAPKASSAAPAQPAIYDPAENIPAPKGVTPENYYQGQQYTQAQTPDQVAKQKSTFQPLAGLKSGVDQTQAQAYGLMAWLGQATHWQGLKDWGLKGYKRNMKESANDGVRVHSFHDIHSTMDFLSWIGSSLGEMAPTMATLVLTDGVGGLVAKGIAKKVIGKEVGKMIEDGVVNEATTSAMRKLALAARAGQIGSAAAGGTALETGSIYGDLAQRGHGNATGTAAAAGLAGGFLYAIPVVRFADKMGFAKPLIEKINQEASSSAGKRILTEAAKQAGLQGAIMPATRIVERAAVAFAEQNPQYLTSPEARKEYWDALASGLAMGTALGGFEGAVGRGHGEADQTPPPSTDHTQPLNAEATIGTAPDENNGPAPPANPPGGGYGLGGHGSGAQSLERRNLRPGYQGDQPAQIPQLEPQNLEPYTGALGGRGSHAVNVDANRRYLGREAAPIPSEPKQVLGGHASGAENRATRNLNPDYQDHPTGPLSPQGETPLHEGPLGGHSSGAQALGLRRYLDPADGRARRLAQEAADAARKAGRALDPRLARRPFRDAIQALAKTLPKKSSGKGVDPQADPLLVAIAKLGGLSRQDAAQQGVDHAHFKDANKVFGRPVFPKNGGMSFDAMAEALSQDGYISQNYSPNELLDKLGHALAGHPVYSDHMDPGTLHAIELLKQVGEGARGAQVMGAVKKAIEGQKLGSRESRIVTNFLDHVSGERTAPANVEGVRQSIRAARAARKYPPLELYQQDATRPPSTSHDLFRSGYTPEMNEQGKRLYELATEARAIDEQRAVDILSKDLPDREVAALLWRLIQENDHGQEQKPAEKPAGNRAGQGEAGHQGRLLAGSEAPAKSAESKSRQGAAPEVKGKSAENGDLFGGKTKSEQAIKDRQEARKQQERNAPPVEAGKGDLFSGKSKQTDLEDHIKKESAQKPGGKKGAKDTPLIEAFNEAYPRLAGTLNPDEIQRLRQGYTDRINGDSQDTDALFPYKAGWDLAAADQRLGNKVSKRDLLKSKPKDQPDTKSSENGTKLVDEAAIEAATHPENKAPEPTDAQKEAGNYKMGHVRIDGLDISIENPKGSERSGTDASGKKWSVKMAHAYGYIRGTVGKDKDHIDVFLGPEADHSRYVYVVDQVDPKTGKFDEHKVMLGFKSEQAAKQGYLDNYEKGWQGLGAITRMTMPEFKLWLKSGDTKKPWAKKLAKPEKSSAPSAAPSGEQKQQTAPTKERGATPPSEPKQKRASNYGKKNKVFTEDAAAKARERLKAKLGRTNAGIDPELMQDAITLAGYHVEAGARSFVDFAKAMVEDLGNGIKPYLRSLYESIRHYPGIDNKGMTEAEKITPDMLDSVGQEASNAPSSDTNLESDRGAAGNEASGAEKPIRNESGGPGKGAGEAGKPAGEGRAQQQGDSGVPDRGAAPVRARGDTGVSRPNGEFDLFGGAPGDTERGGSTESGHEGVQPDRPTSDRPESVAQSDDESLQRRVERQRLVESVKVRPGDLSNIRETLPVLLPQQQEDVHFSEKRLHVDSGRGALFTNGTGTGKTFSGLGLIKRFVKQGKDNIIITVPGEKVASDWVASGKLLGLDITPLKDTKDAGKGVVVTTYANFSQNDALANRKWDLIVPDEAHKLSESKNATATNALETLRALTGHERGRFKYSIMKEPELWAAVQDAKVGTRERSEAWRAFQEKKDIHDAERAQHWENQGTKVQFLSATPFAYEKSVDYAEGFLFDYPPENESTKGGWHHIDPHDQFFIEHFGYRYRYGKLTEPEANVNRDLMQRQFNQWLKDQGALRGRRLDVDKDYSRQFVAVDDLVGAKIDDGMKWLWEKARAFDEAHKGDASAPSNGYRVMLDRLKDNFKYHDRIRLLEASKARHAIPRIREHLALGRKVVIFHSRIKGGAIHPFRFDEYGDLSSEDRARILQERGQEALDRIGKDKEAYNEAVRVFNKERQDLVNLDLASLQRPLTLFEKQFGDKVTFYNGTISKREKRENPDIFNNDKSGVDIIVVQDEGGKEGISLHDTTGKHQRVLINLGLPIKPTQSIQIEGRIYRVGQQSDAVFEYFNTGTIFERRTFAMGIAQRASTAENLALGEEARGLKNAYVEAFEDATSEPPSKEQGKGGKEKDRAYVQQITPFERAKTYYWANREKSGRRDQREGVDYFATPEPLGLKMVEWADMRPGDHALEPSAGHGAIARFFPEDTNNTFVEPEAKLQSKINLRANGNSRMMTFEQLDTGANKFDEIVMNPPFGQGGKTAFDHVEKAVKHLRNGGRIVALVPDGPAANKRWDKLYESDALKDVYLTTEISLPAVTFERAGTTVKSKILVLDKWNGDPTGMRHASQIDLSSADSIKELFDRIEGLTLGKRPLVQEGEAPADSADSGEHFQGDAKGYLNKKGLLVTETETRGGTPVWEVTGNTREFKDILGAKSRGGIGGKWYGPKKAWSFYGVDPTEALAAAINKRDDGGDSVHEDVASYTTDYEISNPTGAAAESGGSEGGSGKGSGDVHASAPVSGWMDLFTPEGKEPDPARARSLARKVKQVRIGSFKTGITKIEDASDVAHILAPLRKEPQESMMALVTDKNDHPLAIIRHTVGVTNAVSVEPHILLGAIHSTEDAAKVWFGHNHPSGNPLQSGADINLTRKLDANLEGTGVEVMGMVVVTPGGKASMFTPGMSTNSVPIEIKPKARTESVPVMGRRFSRINNEDLPKPALAVKAAKEIGADRGVMLLDQRHHLVGWLPMSSEEMAHLRTGERGTGASKLYQALHDSNARAGIIVTPDASDTSFDGAVNVANFLKDNGADPLYVIQDGKAVGEYRTLDHLAGYGRPFRRAGSETKPATGGLSSSEALDAVKPVLNEWKGGPHTVVAETVDDLPSNITAGLSRGDLEKADGLYDPDTGVVWLISRNLRDADHARLTLLHEALGHYGLRALLGDKLTPLLNEVYLTYGNKGLKDIADRYGLDLNNRQDRLVAAEEKLAEMAETNAKPKLVARLVQMIKDWWAKVSRGATLTDAQVRDILKSAAKVVRDGTGATMEVDGKTRPLYHLTKSDHQDAEEQHSKEVMADVKAGAPIDKVFRGMFKLVGVDKATGWTHKKIVHAITEAKFKPDSSMSWMNNMIETARAGLIDRYGLSDEYKQRELRREADERRIALKGVGVVKGLLEAGVDAKEAKVLQSILTGEEVPSEDWKSVSEPIRQAIDDLGWEAVQLGLLDRATFEKHRGAYLHRVYAKHEAERSALGAFASKVLSSRRKNIAGNTLKGRGMEHKVTQQKLLKLVPEKFGLKRQLGNADKSLVGKEFVILDRMSHTGEGTATADGIPEGGAKPRILERVYWPADEPIPKKYLTWKDNGKWEVRRTEGDKVVLWRDFTKEERQNMGEILDARYTIARTFQLMASDIANGRFLKDISGNEEWAWQGEGEPPGVIGEPRARWSTYTQYDWVKVPDGTIPGTRGKKRWGALAGKYVRAEVWRDINELYHMQKPRTWNIILNQWKLNKTARSPVVHLNNVMSNVLFMDLADVRWRDLRRGIYAYRHKTQEYRDALEHGAFGSGFVMQEIKRDLLDPVLDEILAQNTDNTGWFERKVGQHGRMLDTLWRGIGKVDRTMVRYYQAEDELFRMATYMRRLSLGDAPEVAAQVARDTFLNYDIRAPWVNVARASVLPFISYTYRAIPVVAKAIAERPWKLAKYATVAYMVNALGYALAPGNEDEERRSMREQVQGYTWLGTPRMLRMAWKDAYGNPMFLDIRRWIPVGDVFDLHQGHGALPVPAWLQLGGPLMLGAQFALNKDAFTGDKITNPDTDTLAERAAKTATWAYREWMPSAPWIYRSWYWDKLYRSLSGGRDMLGRRYQLGYAAASSLGIKFNPQDVRLGTYYRMREIKKTQDELNSQLWTLENDHRRKLISDSDYNDEKSTIMEKMKNLKGKANEVLGRNQ